ncbi:MAG: hypothetical protein ACK50J_23230 [Planctomyces sp.]
MAIAVASSTIQARRSGGQRTGLAAFSLLYYFELLLTQAGFAPATYESWMYSKPAVEPSVMLTSETTIHNLIPAIFLTPASSRLSQRRLVGVASPISTGQLPLLWLPQG